MISGFHCEGDENCALLRHYAVSSDNYLPAFFDPPDDGTDRLSRNFGKKLPLFAVQLPSGAVLRNELCHILRVASTAGCCISDIVTSEAVSEPHTKDDRRM